MEKYIFNILNNILKNQYIYKKCKLYMEKYIFNILNNILKNQYIYIKISILIF